jgi:hypothetical protein
MRRVGATVLLDAVARAVETNARARMTRGRDAQNRLARASLPTPRRPENRPRLREFEAVLFLRRATRCKRFHAIEPLAPLLF